MLYLCLIAIKFVCFFMFVAAPAEADQNTEPNLHRINAGCELLVEIKDARINIDHFVLYVPSDYNEANDWPVIFFYHGAGNKPTTTLFRKLTQDRGFIIAAMEFAPLPGDKLTRGQYLNYLKTELKNMAAVKKYLTTQQNINIDRKRIFLAGISKGGWLASDLLEYRPQVWNGVAILCAGRTRLMGTDTLSQLKHKPVYIGAGETDFNLSAAEKAFADYRRCGADVTFEQYKGLGHDVAPNSPKLRKWLFDNSAHKADSAKKSSQSDADANSS